MRLLFCLVSILILLPITNAWAQTATIADDAEYLGAKLDKQHPVKFYPSGELESATLKLDYAVGDKIFEAGKAITFFKDGSISEGTLKNQFKFKDLTFIKGSIKFHKNGVVAAGEGQVASFDANLQLPTNARLELNDAGRVTLVTAPTAYILQLLGTSLRGGVGTFLKFDDKAGAYKLYKGSNGAPQLVGRLAIQRGRAGQVLKVLAVIIPIDSGFTFQSNDPNADSNPTCDSLWVYSGTFVINNLNFGNGPRLCLKNNRLVSVTVNQSVIVGSYQYSVGETVLLDDSGNVIPTQFINP